MSNAPISPADWILDSNGAAYHLHLQPDWVPDTIITVGDPGRVEAVSQYFDAITHRVKHREFLSHIGQLNGHPIMVISTGIGTDNIDIVLHELDGLVNIDSSTRLVKNPLKSLTFIRLGTAGGIHPATQLGEIVISKGALGLDGLMHFYHKDLNPNAEKAHRQFPELPKPYWSQATPDLLSSAQFNISARLVNTLTAPGFYGPQGRQTRLQTESQQWVNKLFDFELTNGESLYNAEMETAGLYGLATHLGHRAVSLSVILADRRAGTFHPHPDKAMSEFLSLSMKWIEELITS